jgi:hypothetical protein
MKTHENIDPPVPGGKGPGVEAPESWVGQVFTDVPPMVINYGLLCLVSLLVLLLVLVENGLHVKAMIPPLIGLLAVVFRWRPGVGLVLGSLGGLLLLDSFRDMDQGAWITRPTWHPSNLLLCVSVLAFVIGHLRLLSLTRNIVPRDLRQSTLASGSTSEASRQLRPAAAPLERRTKDADPREEFLGLFLSLPVWIILGQLLCLWLHRQTTSLPLHGEFWRLLVLFLASSAILITVGVVFSQWRSRTMSSAEASLILQDEQWLETRPEQMLVGQWLAWARERLMGKEKR